MLNIKWQAKQVIRRFGYDIIEYGPNSSNEVFRRIKLIKNFNIDLILDVGANKGQFASMMRRLGYRGEIISFEPLKTAFSILEKKAARDKLWHVNNFAIGDKNMTSTINVAKELPASSIRSMDKELEAHHAFVNTQEIEIKTLDSIFSSFVPTGRNVYLKIDTQGYEKNVIDGAQNALSKIRGIQVESSLVSLYQGETLLHEMLPYMLQKNYTLMSIEPGFFDKQTGQLLQSDMVFFQTRLLNNSMKN